MDVCLYGGAFNPPHLTHQRVIEAALAQLPVQRVLVLPTGQHPLKPQPLAPADARVELCRLAFADIPGVTIDDWELRQPGPSYSVDTIQHFREYVTGGRRPYWILGADNLRILPEWHRYRELLELAIIVTCPRMGHPVDEQTIAELPAAQRAEILAHVLDVEPDDVSASAIRAALTRGEACDRWLHPAVRKRILELGLYGTGEVT